MPLAAGNSREVISNNIREMIASGYPQRQAVAASLSNARRHPRADGGDVGSGGNNVRRKEPTVITLPDRPPIASPPNILGSEYDNLPPQRGAGVLGALLPGAVPSSYTPNDAVDKALNNAARQWMSEHDVPHRRADGGPVSGGGNIEPPDFTDRYNTPLSPSDETRFQSWAAKGGRAGDLRDYDLRGAWQSNAQAAANGHLPDTFKKPNHPTFSDESKYNGVDGMQGGTWSQQGKRWSYTASPTNLNMYGASGLQGYMRRVEPDVQLTMPPQRQSGGFIPHRQFGGMTPPMGLPTAQPMHTPRVGGVGAGGMGSMRPPHLGAPRMPHMGMPHLGGMRGFAAGGGPVTYLKPEFSKDQLMGGGLQRLIDGANGDSDLQSIIHSLRYHGLSVPSSLSDVPGYRRGGGARGFADGGDTGMTPGLAPSNVTQNPLYQSLIQRYSSMTPEQLQEFAARAGNTQQGQVAQHVLMQKRMKAGSQPATPQLGQAQQQQQQQQIQGAQALGATPGLGTASPSGVSITQGTGSGLSTDPTQPNQVPAQGFALGGSPMGISPSQAEPWWTRQEARQADSGFLNSSVPGRTDHIPANPAADSYVIPAEEVAGLGEGNSLAGAHMLQLAFGMGPYGTRMPPARHGPGPPRPPAPRLPAEESLGGARHGTGQGQVPIMAAGGEFIIPPHIVAAIGRGNVRRGHRVLDKLVMQLRKEHVKTLKSLQGPVKQ